MYIASSEAFLKLSYTLICKQLDPTDSNVRLPYSDVGWELKMKGPAWYKIFWDLLLSPGDILRLEATFRQNMLDIDFDVVPRSPDELWGHDLPYPLMTALTKNASMMLAWNNTLQMLDQYFW